MTRRKTLCIDLRWIDASGVGTYIQGIMPGIVTELQEFAVVGLGNLSRLRDFSWSEASNVSLVSCNAARYSLAEQFQIPSAIPRHTDLFFSPYYTIPLLYHGRIAATVHDMSHLLLGEITDDFRKRIYAKTMYAQLRRRAEVIFTVSWFSKSELLRLTHGSDSENIVPIHLGVSPDWQNASSLEPQHGQPYFVCVGNIKPYKNIHRLVKAFLKVQDRLPHDLLVVGQSGGLITGESDEFFRTIREAGSRIRLLGHVTRADLLSLVGHANALIMPSLYEGFGLPPIEAMAAGVPVAVSRAASLPEVCGDAALYFDPLNVDDIADKLLRLATEPDLCDSLVTKGIIRSRAFSWDSCSFTTARALRGALLSSGP